MKSICKACGKEYEVEDIFKELFGVEAPASSDKLCPTCEAAWIKAHKGETYEGE